MATPARNPFRPPLLFDAAGRPLARRVMSTRWLILTIGVIMLGIFLAIGATTASGGLHPLGIFLGFMGLVGTIIVLIQRSAVRGLNRQHGALHAALTGVDFRLFVPESGDEMSDDERAIWEPFARLKELKTGAAGVQWLADGTIDGHDVRVISHQYSERRGSDRRDVNHLVVAQAVPSAWPNTSLRPESLMSRMISQFGREDLQLEDAEFNRRFRISSDDPDFALTLLSPDVQAWMNERQQAREAPYGVMATLSRFVVGAFETWHLADGWLFCLEPPSTVAFDEQVTVLMRRPHEMLERAGLLELMRDV